MKTSLYNTAKITLSISLITLALGMVALLPLAKIHAASKKDASPNQQAQDNQQGDSQDTPSLAQVVAPFMGSSTASTSPAVANKDADQAATTTPTIQRENQSLKDTPPANPTYNKTLENLLNTAVAPGSDTKKVLKETKATEARIQKEMATSTAVSTTATSSTATTTAAGTTGPTATGGSNQFAPSNYYIPLDNLSVTATYGFSALAMALGIAGALLILKEPREQMAWAATPLTEPSLLES